VLPQVLQALVRWLLAVALPRALAAPLGGLWQQQLLRLPAKQMMEAGQKSEMRTVAVTARTHPALLRLVATIQACQEP